MRNLIIDDRALERNRLRAMNIRADGADFLLRHVADDLSIRLSTVERQFQIAIDLNSVGNLVAKTLHASGKINRIIQSRTTAFADKLSTTVVTRDDMLPFESSRVDFITSNLTLQFVNDIPGTLVQIRRALKPDGLFLGALVGGNSLAELRQSFLGAEAEITGNVRARILPFIDVRDAGGLLQRAGFSVPVADTDCVTVRYDTAFDLMRDLRAMGASNCLLNRDKSFLRRDILTRMAEIYSRDFSDADGRIRATFDIISLSGWAPHHSQQQPLKPGSAEVRLIDVLEKPQSE